MWRLIDGTFEPLSVRRQEIDFPEQAEEFLLLSDLLSAHRTVDRPCKTDFEGAVTPPVAMQFLNEKARDPFRLEMPTVVERTASDNHRASKFPERHPEMSVEQTEAMCTIDINTGAFVGHRNLEETIFNTNIEATQAIARQLRLRNLGGIIIVDFIDMNDKEHQRRVLHSLDVAMAKDNVKYSLSGFSALGLVEMTRKRTRESLEHILCGECNVCHGRGYVKTVETVCFEILREIVRVNRAYDTDKFIVYASSSVSESLINDEYHNLAELEVFIGKQIKVQTENMYNQEQFDVVMM